MTTWHHDDNYYHAIKPSFSRTTNNHRIWNDYVKCIVNSTNCKVCCFLVNFIQKDVKYDLIVIPKDIKRT